MELIEDRLLHVCLAEESGLLVGFKSSEIVEASGANSPTVSPMRSSRSIAVATLITVLGTALTGCGTNEDPDSKTSAESSTAGFAPSPTDASPHVDWKPASVGIAQFYAPADWMIKSGGKQILTMRAPNNKIGLSPGAGHVSADVYSTEGGVQAEIGELAKLAQDQYKGDSNLTKLERLPDDTFNGSPFYHFRAETEFTWEDHYATLVPDAGMQVAVTWSFNKSDIDRKGAEALIAPIMATYEVL